MAIEQLGSECAEMVDVEVKTPVSLKGEQLLLSQNTSIGSNSVTFGNAAAARLRAATTWLRRCSTRRRSIEKLPAPQRLADDLMSDQESGDHKKDVDADEAALETGDAGVERDDRDDRNGAQAVDINEPACPRGSPGKITITGAAPQSRRSVLKTCPNRRYGAKHYQRIAGQRRGGTSGRRIAPAAALVRRVRR
jgi:hypothetical protein